MVDALLVLSMFGTSVCFFGCWWELCKRITPVTAMFMYLKLLHFVSQYHHSHIGRLARNWGFMQFDVMRWVAASQCS